MMGYVRTTNQDGSYRLVYYREFGAVLTGRLLSETALNGVLSDLPDPVSHAALIEALNNAGLLADGDSPTPNPVTKPANTDLPTISGTAQEGSVLTVSNGTWSGNPSAYQYQWYADGIAISGATNATRTLSSFDVGKIITATVRAVNSGGTKSVISLGTAAVSAVTFPVDIPSTDLPALELEFVGDNPNTVFPPPVAIKTLPPEYKPGDVIRLYLDAGYTITGTNSIAHTLTNAEASGSPISFGTAISSIQSDKHAFAVRGERGSLFSATSPTLVHGDAVAPILMSSVTLSGAENAPMAAAAAYNEPVTVVLGGVDAGLLELVTPGLSTTHTVRLVGDTLLNFESGKTSYSYTLTPTDRGTNVGPTATFSFTVTNQADIPTAPAFAGVASGAAPNSVYTSNTVKLAGMGPGVIGKNGRVAPGTTYSKNGGPFTDVPFSYQNDDEFALRRTTGNLIARYDATIYFDTLPAVYGVTVGIVAVTLDPATKNQLATLFNGNMGVTGAPSSGVPASVRATLSKTTGKLYYEVTVSSLGGNGLLIGVIDPDQSLTDYSRPGSSGTLPGASFDARDPLYILVNGTSKTAAVDHNGNYLGDSGAIASGVRTYGIGLDLVNDRLFYRSDRWASDQDPSVPVTGIDLSSLPITALFPYLGPCDDTNVATINFGGTPFVYGLPAGFSPYQ
jgi:hypothetical protein